MIKNRQRNLIDFFLQIKPPGGQQVYERCATSSIISYCCSITKACLTLFDPIDCFMSGSSVFHSRSLTSTVFRVCSDSCSLSQWYYLTRSSSVTFFSCPQSFPASEFFPVSWLFPSGRQNIGALASASVLPMSIQGWHPLGLTGLISLQSKGFSRVFSSTTILQLSVFFKFLHPYITIG